MLLEVCAYNIQSCIIAEKSGAGRIELCADPAAGGTTPSIGLIAYALEHVAIPIFPMIRPRGGNFAYDKHELEIMRRDIMACKDAGCKGIATGIHKPGLTIDTENLKRLVEWAYPMQVTCHKVFDRTTDAYLALEEVIATGCSRILTSGLGKTAIDGMGVLAQLIEQAAGRITIMPGGGVRATNIAQLVSGTGAIEYHSSGIITADGNYMADEGEVRMMVRGMNNYS
ncbi:MAG: copper homeostasis protein CutC [Bacteroidota bacterium]